MIYINRYIKTSSRNYSQVVTKGFKYIFAKSIYLATILDKYLKKWGEASNIALWNPVNKI